MAFGIVCAVTLMMLLVVITPKAGAFSQHYYDWQDNGGNCDLANSDCGTRIELMAGETRFVRDTGVQVQAYFTSPNGRLSVNNANFCPGSGGDEWQSGDYYGPGSGHSLSNNTVVTDITLKRENGTVIATGVGRYNTGCNQAVTFDLTNLERHPNLPNLFFVNIDIEHRNKRGGVCERDTATCDGIKNAFQLRISGNSAYQIAQKAGNGANNQVTMQQGNNFASNSHVNYRIRFGSSCEISGPTTATLRIYDLDAGGGSGGAQVGNLTMRLIHISPTNERTIQDLSISGAANKERLYNFTARRNYNYIWEINNVYYNNTIQLSTPFDGIYFNQKCPDPNMTCGFPSIGTIESATPFSTTMNGGWIGDQPAKASTLRYQVLNSGGTQVGSGQYVINRLVPGSFTRPLNIPPLPAGQYTLRGQHISGDAQGSNGNCVGSFAVADKPYFKVYNGDIRVGGGFTSVADCNALVSNANIHAFNSGSNGAGGQVAVLATGLINRFTSASMRTSPPLLPKGLTFANTGAGNPNSAYGGGYDKHACMPNYWGMKPVSQPLSPNTVPGNSNVSGRQNIYINGDAYITGDIIFSSAGWTSVANIPSYRLIVQGNIYISHTVQRLDGMYVAVPRPTNVNGTGTIYTCAVGGPSVPATAQIASECRQRKLVVNGAFIARQVKLLRTINSFSMASPSETVSNSRAAEVFNFSPAVWMALPNDPESAVLHYDAITSLPPVL